MQNAIEVASLRVRYRAKSKWIEAVTDLSFKVEPGEIVGFLGPNGAGKSSTLKSLMGFIEPAAGSQKIFGEVAGTLPAKAKVGYLPEVALYYPFLTPLETLRLYGRLQGLKGVALKKEAQELLDRVGLSAAMKKQNRTLSKGMLQRVGIAQSLLGAPPLLILDEVTSGLDPVGRRELRELLKERQRMGATLFFSSHELSEVDMLCDRILVIDKGVLIDERRTHELKDTLRIFELKFTGGCELSDLGVVRREDGYQFASFGTEPKLLQAMERVRLAGDQILGVRSQEGSLEDYFVQTIGRAA